MRLWMATTAIQIWRRNKHKIIIIIDLGNEFI